LENGETSIAVAEIYLPFISKNLFVCLICLFFFFGISIQTREPGRGNYKGGSLQLMMQLEGTYKKKKSGNTSEYKVGSARLTKWCVAKLASLEIFKTFHLGMENS
jgi:hypothetical protein